MVKADIPIFPFLVIISFLGYIKMVDGTVDSFMEAVRSSQLPGSRVSAALLEGSADLGSPRGLGLEASLL